MNRSQYALAPHYMGADQENIDKRLATLGINSLAHINAVLAEMPETDTETMQRQYSQLHLFLLSVKNMLCSKSKIFRYVALKTFLSIFHIDPPKHIKHVYTMVSLMCQPTLKNALQTAIDLKMGSIKHKKKKDEQLTLLASLAAVKVVEGDFESSIVRSRPGSSAHLLRKFKNMTADNLEKMLDSSDMNAPQKIASCFAATVAMTLRVTGLPRIVDWTPLVEIPMIAASGDKMGRQLIPTIGVTESAAIRKGLREMGKGMAMAGPELASFVKSEYAKKRSNTDWRR